MYSWFVNSSLEVQVYEGWVNPSLMYDFANEENARNHNVIDDIAIPVKEGFRTNTNRIGMKADLYPKVKYYIPEQYVEAFFEIIGEFGYLPFDSGTTDINLGDLLD